MNTCVVHVVPLPASVPVLPALGPPRAAVHGALAQAQLGGGDLDQLVPGNVPGDTEI